MTFVQTPLGLAQPHRNQQLFSDYYLDSILPSRPEWKLLAADAAPVLAAITKIFAAYTPTNNEAQLENDLVRPVLDELGHFYEVQAALKTADGTKKPDYIMYRDAAALQANKGVSPLTEALLAPGMIAICDAKYWDRNLDMAVKSGADALSNKNPAYQIAFYVQQSGATWGILTNGRLWRLYHKDTAHKLDRYYEVDLKALVDAGDVAGFLYFYAFFHRSAFAEGPLSLTALLNASTDYARAIGNSLKDQVYDALRHIAQGFLDYPGNQLQTDPATLKQIYDHSLIVLYRLLFILYAEARELLPVRESGMYRDRYSLYAITRSVAQDLGLGMRLLANSATLWPRLQSLFQIINVGSPPLKVATFNGGLFDPAKYPFLEQHSVGDAHLQQALDGLARVQGQFIDYRDLAERHLGTIYEGLLEYHLLPIAPEGEWTVAIVNDKGERHRTGSYYTPDFVVQYIVDQAVGPVLRRAVEGAQSDAEKIQAVLSVNVCDPAMGSGHFPVAAMEYIARFLVDLAVPAEADAQGEADLAYWKRRVAQSCIYGVDLNPLAVDLAKLSLWLATVAKGRPLSFLDHHLRCGNALVGGRVATLGRGAVRPKKASKKATPATASGQLSMLDDPAFAGAMGAAVGSMWQIEEQHGNTIAEVKEQEQLYATVRAELVSRYKTQADLATATDFGVVIDPALARTLAEYEASRGKGAFAMPAYEKVLGEVRALVAQQRFFHWDLEFPEVFFDRHGRPLGDTAGFDAVIGNPPYVRQEQLGPLKGYFQEAYAETYHGVADLYVYFYHQGLRLLQQGGRMSYIVTNKWMRAGYGEPLRAFFAAQGGLKQIVDFGHAPIFEDADVFPCIVVLEKQADDAQPADDEVLVTTFPREALKLVRLDGYIQRYGHRVSSSRFGRYAWSLESSEVDGLLEKMKHVGVPLTEYAKVAPYRGVLTGFNEAFLIDTPTKERLIHEDSRSAEIIKPYLRGQDLERWSTAWSGFWLIFTRRGIDISGYPAIERYLLKYRDRLEPRPQNWVGEKWSGRKPGPYKWYEIQDTVGYWETFSKPKIFYPDITWRSQFSLDTGGHFSNNTVYFLPTDDPWLLAVLNSPLLWSYCWREAVHGKDEALRFFSEFVERIPIASPTDEIRAEVEPAVARLIAITKADQESRRDTLDWLRTEYGVEAPGQKLDDFAALDEAAFIEEVRKRRPKSLGTLTPAGLKGLRAGYAEQATPVRERKAEALTLERRIAALVNQAYGLTPEEVELLWRTAPPRMPVGR